MTQQETRSKEQQVLESAQIYENRLVPILFEPWGRRLLESVPVEPGQHLLDVACGSGAVSRLAAQRVGDQGTVTGLDLNPGMIETAKNVCKDVSPPIEFHVGDATNLPFEDDRFDGVLCQQGVQFIPDKQAAIDQMHRVVKPSGWVTFTEWLPIEHIPGFRVLCDALDRHVDTKAGDVMRTPFSDGDGAALRQMAEQAGFQKIHQTVQVGSIHYPSADDFTQWSIDSVPPGPKGHLKAMYESVPADKRKALFEEVRNGLASFTGDDGVVFPMSTQQIIARK